MEIENRNINKENINLNLELERVAPGDRWRPIDRDIILESLTEGLEHVYQQTKSRDFYVSALDGKVYTVRQEITEPLPPQKFSLYGE